MTILNIEESAFELMMARFEALAQKVEQLCWLQENEKVAGCYRRMFLA